MSKFEHLPYLVKATLRDVDVAVAHLHVYPETLYYCYTVLVVPQVLWSTVSQSLMSAPHHGRAGYYNDTWVLLTTVYENWVPDAVGMVAWSYR